jgi:Holliday junction resolvasome RuvABC endonuclease subunit
MIIAIDPGIDEVGLACFDTSDWCRSQSLGALLSRLGPYAVLRTKPETPLPLRLEQLASGLQEFMADRSIEHCYIERSAKAGSYASRRRRQQTKGAINAKAIQLLDYATGALVVAAAFENIPVTLVPAPSSSKKSRHDLVLWGLRQIEHSIARLTRPSPDLLCAIWLGTAVLTDDRYAPQALAR